MWPAQSRSEGAAHNALAQLSWVLQVLSLASRQHWNQPEVHGPVPPSCHRNGLGTEPNPAVRPSSHRAFEDGDCRGLLRPDQIQPKALGESSSLHHTLSLW